jgi:cobalt-precorrin-6B (C15)-methyltransferase
MKWLRDEEFIRGEVPMTKFEARVMTLTMMNIGTQDVFLDIGAGTGSVAVQAAILGAKVFAIERKLDGVELIKRNAENNGVQVEVVNGTAPRDIEAIDGYNKCFIGGSTGKLKDILITITDKLPSDGIVCGNFIIPDNMVEFKNYIKDLGYVDIEVRQIQASVMDKFGLMKGQNPVYIVKGRKK